MASKSKEEKATVVSVDLHGKSGPFAIARLLSSKRLRFSFSLNDDVWQSDSIPQAGSFVMVSDFQKQEGGWRAMSARLFTFADEDRADPQPPEE